jgi:rhodanese-related sulfurtransferase
MRKVSPAALMEKIKTENGNLKILDVLTRESYAAGHIPGAVHIPLEQLKKRAPKEIPKDTEVVVYCASPT